MADLRHFKLILAGVSKWNCWRIENPGVTPDLTETCLRGARLSEADLRGANLYVANLSEANLMEAKLGWADLRAANLSKAKLNGASLSMANLGGANLSLANLCTAKLGQAKLQGANLFGAALIGADLIQAELNRAKLNGANLFNADLNGADLSEADLSGANLVEANLRNANLRNANLRNANLRGVDLRSAQLYKAVLSNADLESARLQGATLDEANATGISLWEAQRGGWSIKGIICERAYWGVARTDVVEYALGDFEKLCSQQPSIELVYKGGITRFQLHTLPFLLDRLANQNPGTTVRLSRIEEASGGTKVVISVEEGDATLLQADILRIQALQLEASLNKQSATYLETLLESTIAQFFESVPKIIEAAAMKQNTFNGPVGTYIENGSQHQVTTNQTVTTIQEIAAEAQRRSNELSLSAEDADILKMALENLNQKHAPSDGVVKQSLLSVRHVLEHAAGAMIGHEASVWLHALAAKVDLALRHLGS